jgi:tetratricopeptide (TPR) repeat protein
MPISIRFAAVGMLAALLAPALGAEAKEIWEYPWIEVRSEHFVVESALSEEKTRALVTDLERFRKMASVLTSLRRFEERIPTEIYVLPRAEADLGLRNGILGYLLPSQRANYAVITEAGSSSDEVLKHEYVHFLVRNQGSAAVFPRWIDEGFAELLMTLDVSDDGTRLEYAKPHPWRMQSLAMGDWIPFRTLLEARDSLGRDRDAMFYAQSWFLLHYLMTGRPGVSFSAQLTQFLRLRESGSEPAPAFEQAFGLEVGSLELVLRKYARRAKYTRVQLKEPLPPVAAKVRPVPAAEVAARLALLSLERGELKPATTYDEAALALDPNHATALVVAGDLLKVQKRWDEAIPNYERAIALEPQDAHHELDFGEYYLHRAQQEEDAAKRAEWLVEARRHLFRSYKLDPDDPETLAQNGLTYLVEGTNPEKAVESLEQAHALLPSQTHIQGYLASAYLASQQRERARPIVLRLIAWSHDGENPALKAMLDALDAPAPDGDAKREAEKPEPAPAP